MCPEMIMCGHLAVIIKCPFRMYYEDFLQYATQQVRCIFLALQSY